MHGTLSLPLVVALSPAWGAAASAPAAAAPVIAAESLDALFDGADSRAPAVFLAGKAQDWDYQRLRRTKDILSNGGAYGGRPILPFAFNLKGGGTATAQSAGLEGFLYEERRIAKEKGRDAVLSNLDDYFKYLDALLSQADTTREARAKIAAIRDSSVSTEERYSNLIGFVTEYTDGLRREMGRRDGSAWIKQARIYEIFPRAYNLEGKRLAEGRAMKAGFFADFAESDLLELKGQGFDTLWVMGIFPIGERGRWGTGGGSPYSVKDHEGINPDLGAPDEFRAFVRRVHSAGMKVIIDFIPNHTAMDSKLLAEDPAFFIGREADPSRPRGPPYGSFDYDAKGKIYWISHGGYDSNGGKDYWVDTAQVNYANPALRRRMIAIVKDWVRLYGVDGFRVDMAYQVLNAYFGRNWGVSLPRREFLEELITEVRVDYPGTGFIAEAYDGWDALSSSGFDLIYGKNNIDRPGGHHGWFDALAGRDPGWIREAIRRAGFLHWQTGGADMMDFVGNHDEASPQRTFGPWARGASFLTLMMPGSVLFYGSQEIGYDKPNLEKEPKSIPFSVPATVDWKNADPGAKKFYSETFAAAKSLHAALGETDLEALDGASAGWAGYLLTSRGGGKKAAVLANPTGNRVDVRISMPELGIDYRGELPPYGSALLRF